MTTSFLKKISVQKFTHPWNHFVIDNFLPLDTFERAQKSLCTIREGYQKRDDDPFDLNFMFLPDLPLARFFLSSEFQGFLEKHTDSELEIYEKGLVQLRRMTPTSPAFAPHVDRQDERSLVCILYLSPDWEKAKGGELILHRDETSPADGPDSKVVEPLANRMILFLSDDFHWHSVKKVTNWDRYSIISEWIVTERNSP